MARGASRILTRHDPPPARRPLSALLAQARSAHRQASQPGHLRHARGGREARARGAVLQAARMSDATGLAAHADWYRTFFRGLALDLWRAVVPPELTRAEADYLVR